MSTSGASFDELAEFLRAHRREQTLLFVGAGFTCGSRSLAGTIPDGKQLATILNEKLGRTEPLSLSVAAFEYLEQYGPEAYAKLLSDNFRVTEPSPEIQKISSQNWLRIYTTNYDNAVECSCEISPSAVISPINSKSPKVFSSKLVHLHGAIDHLTPQTVTNLKLKFDDFDAAIDENLLYMFQRDLVNCAAAIFVGYSFRDLDIIRTIRVSGVPKARISFILSDTINDEDRIRLNRYGSVYSVGRDGLFEIINLEPLPSISPSELFAPVNFELQQYVSSKNRVTNEEILRIYTMGRIEPHHFEAAETQPRFVLHRNAVSTIIDNFDIGERLILIHSDIGNGKTAVVKHLTYLLHQRSIQCFLYIGGSSVDAREVAFFKGLGPLVCLVFDSDLVAPNTVLDYADRVPEARILYTIRSVHIELRRRGGWDKLQQFAVSDLNRLSDEEIEELREIFETYGLWGSEGRNARAVSRFFSSMKGDLRSILLNLFHTEYIKQAITESVREIIAVSDSVRDLYVLILILSYFGLRPSSPYIQRIAGVGALNEFMNQMEEDNDIIENIRFHNGAFIYYSSTYASFVIKNIVPDSLKSKLMLEILSRTEHFEVDVIRSLRVALTRFGDVTELFSDSSHRAERILAYYDSISRIRSQNGLYLFWLQFAIACTAFNRFDLAEVYFANAYRLAQKFDPFQIDNHFAKFLLKSRMRRADQYADFFWAFDEAHKLSIAQYRTRDEARFPLEVFAMYGAYFETVGRQIETVDRGVARSLLISLREELSVAGREATYGGLRQAAVVSVDKGIDVLLI